MKYFFSILIILSQFTSFSQITIEGKIHNYDGKAIISYHPTIEGIYTPYWKEVKPKPDGSFTIKYVNEGYGTTNIFFNSLVYRFFHGSDSKIYFELDQDKIIKPKKIINRYFTNDSIKQKATLKIRGDHQEINQFYNRQIRSSYYTTRSVNGSYFSKMVYKASIPEQVNLLLDSLIQHELDQINRLSFQIDLEDPSSDEKIKEIKSFLENEVQAFYGGVFLNGMFLKRKEQVIRLSKDSTAARNIYNQDWEEFIENYAFEAFNNLKSIPNSPDYIDNLESLMLTMDSYKDYGLPQSTKSLDEIIVDQLFNYDKRFFSDKKSAFAYSLFVLQGYLMNQVAYSPILLYSVYELQNRYPDSELLKHYDPLVAKLEDYLKASQRSFNDGKIIHRKYDSFEELISRFEGKNILLDIWATWCPPCIKEFENKEKLQPFVDSGKIEFLYISIDKSKWDDRWKNCIKYNQLNGYHYRADEEFIADMWEKLGGYKGAIPRYALIGKNGEIFLNTAARPSEDDKLVSQINDLIQQMKN